ncbi:MAG: mobile mystery protein A [Aquidulcibacter sp.]|nr:mobile mystery protein A [Aquidulcibacter sp.]
MSPDQTILARKSIDRRLASLRGEPLTVPPSGWVKAIREALGMTTRQLAARMGAARSRVTAVEKAEVTGSTSIKTMRETAEAMGCTFVYAIVPTKPLDDLLRDQAMSKADQELARLHHTMRLENQALTKEDLITERERLVVELLSGPLSRVWDEE